MGTSQSTSEESKHDTSLPFDAEKKEEPNNDSPPRAQTQFVNKEIPISYVYLAGRKYNQDATWLPFTSKKKVTQFALFEDFTFVNSEADQIDYIITANDINLDHPDLRKLIAKHNPKVDNIVEALSYIAKR